VIDIWLLSFERKPSFVWNYFTVSIGNENEVICNEHKAKLSFNGNTTTTSRQHINELNGRVASRRPSLNCSLIVLSPVTT